MKNRMMIVKKEIVGPAYMNIEVGKTDDSGDQTLAYLAIKICDTNGCKVDIEKTIGEEIPNIKFLIRGTWELATFIEALEEATRILKSEFKSPEEVGFDQ